MTPETLAKSGTEHAHQVALFAWAAVARLHGFKAADEWAKGAKGVAELRWQSEPVDALEWLHAIPNGGVRGDDEKSRAIRGGQLKAEGVRSGVPDIFLPWPLFENTYDGCGDCKGFSERMIRYAGLYIEMKKPSMKPKREGMGGVSVEQKAFGEYAKSVGYGFAVCYSWREAADVIRSYIEWKG